MYTGKLDLLTLLLYVLLGVLAAVCVNKAQCARGTIQIGNRFAIDRSVIGYGILVLVFTFFATFRKVDTNLGGADALNYQQIFIHALDKDHELYMRIQEPLFRWYCRFIRLFTDDPRVFFAISYGFIIVCYCVFIHKFCAKRASYIPFLLLIFPYLKAYCTLRSSMAVAVCLLSWVMLDKNRWVSIALSVAAVLIHRMSIAYAVFIVFDLILGKRLCKLNGWRLGLTIFGISFAGVWVARGISWLFVNSGVLGPDTWYLRRNLEQPLFARFPMFLAHMLLFFALVILSGRMENTKKWLSIKRFCCYDIIVLPATLILGFWRANEYMYVPRLVMWSMLIPEGEKLFTESVMNNKRLKKTNKLKFLHSEKGLRVLYRGTVCAVFAFWLVFRICSEWDDLKIMPYVLNLF